ncbi:MAG: 30S ribosomal protein S6--L-glutamate ligase [Gammaproteobacteria bacterium]|jgi:ribosomal protein S6--L-glutamate ligase
MKIALLSQNRKLYSTAKLVETAENRGHEVVVMDVLRAYMKIAAHNPTMHYRGERLGGFDAVIPRIGASVTGYGTAVLRQFEMTGVASLNESVAITRARDKLRLMQLLARKDVSIPRTGYANRPDEIRDVIKMVGGTPLVIKLLEGARHLGVVLAETQKAAQSVIEVFMDIRTDILIQEYMPEARNSDLRCIVVGGKVAAAIKRQAPAGEFRTGSHYGSKASPVRITPQERAVATRAARVIGLNVAGVDIVRSNRGPVVTDVISSPGLQEIESATGKNLADTIIANLEKLKPGKTRTRGKG